jgi:predicted acylesterase/phospholipase RssA
MKALQKANLLHSVVEMIGISGGALFALLYILGYTLHDIERLSLEFDFSILRNIDIEMACMFPITFGLDTGETLSRLVETILKQKGFSASTTFAALAERCPIRFRCYATEIQSSTIREFSVTKTPSMTVLLAVRASMCLPFLYMPIRDPNSTDILMDGGVLHNLPIAFMNPEEVAETFSIQFMEGKTNPSTEEIGMFDMFRYIFNSTIRMKQIPYNGIYPDNLLRIPIGNAETAVSFEQTVEEKSACIAIGERITTEFLQKNHRVLPKRRFSAA